MSLILFALAAAAGDARPLSPAERTVITDAIASFLPSRPTIATDPVKADAVIVCGRAAGRTFKVAITRNAAGRIVAASEAAVMSPSRSAVDRLVVMQMCINNGYVTF